MMIKLNKSWKSFITFKRNKNKNNTYNNYTITLCMHKMNTHIFQNMEIKNIKYGRSSSRHKSYWMYHLNTNDESYRAIVTELNKMKSIIL